MLTNSKRNNASHFIVRSSKLFVAASCALIIVLFTLFGCGGGGGEDGAAAPETNVGGGYTLKASGGTLNDGSGAKGLVVLATLRKDGGWGPVYQWNVTIADPDGYTLAAKYYDPDQGSYMAWEWAGLDPVAGTYRITATDGNITLSYDFTVTSSVLPRPALNASYIDNDMTISWPPVGAGSYSYIVCAPDSTCAGGMTTSTSEIVSFPTLTAGDYLVQVNAYATNRLALYENHSASPGLAPHENVSTYTFTYPVGGDQAAGHYSLRVAGGVLDYGLRSPGNTPIYGLALWTSIQDITNINNPVAPAGDWNVVVTDPNGLAMNYIYPAKDRHYAYWYYDIEPVSSGTYTVTVTYGSASETAAFSLANTPPALAPLSYTQINASLVPNAGNASLNDISIWWQAVSGAKSYYVNLWADVWDNAAKQYDYQEVWGGWVNTNAARVLNGEVRSGLMCDVYVTAYEVDMTSAAPPATAPTRADMSENYYGYYLTFATP